GEVVLAHDALRDQDGVLEIVATPGHEGDEDVAPERELAHFGRRAIGDHVAALHAVPRQHDRTLIHAGVLVRSLVLHEIVDVDAGINGTGELVRLDDAPRRIDALGHPITLGDRRDARVTRYGAFHSVPPERRV